MMSRTKIQLFVTGLSMTLILLMLTVSSISAQEQHPIDRWADSCMGKDPSTAGMLRCLEQAYAMWDNALNDEYQTLRGLLTPQGLAALKTAQRAWIAYRDAEFTAIDTIYGSLDGTMWFVTRMSAKVEFVRSRVQELRLYSSSLIEGR